MPYTKEDKDIARRIIEDKTLVDFLNRYLLQPQQQWKGEVIDLSNEALGELVKADVLAQQKILQRFGEIKKMATETGGSPTPIAPK